MLCEIQGQLVQVAILALQHEEEGLVIENGVGSHEKPARDVVSPPQGDVAGTFLMVRLLVHHEVLADDDYASRTDVTWDLDQHVRCLVYRENILADHMVKAKVHLVHC